MLKGAVLGSPIGHSLSPVLHNTAFSLLSIEGSYEAIDVPSGTLSEFFAASKDKFDYLSLTMPLKEEALSLALNFDPLSIRIGSANTLYRIGDKWHGTSTDGSGLLSALKVAGFSTFSNVLILGAGGTSRAAAGALDHISEKISVMGRTSTRRQALEKCVTRSAFEYLPWFNEADLSSYDLVVNTTPAGAADLLAENLPPVISAPLFDVIYKPWPTVLASRWSDRGGAVINGKELLLWQGLDQMELVLGKQLDLGFMAPRIRDRLYQG